MEITKSQEKRFLQEVKRENQEIDRELKKAGFTRKSSYFRKYIAVDSAGYPKTRISFKDYCLYRLEGERAKDVFATSIVALPKKKKKQKLVELTGPAMSAWGVYSNYGRKAANLYLQGKPYKHLKKKTT